ncbi:MAG: aminoacyl-tRNA hydrolase [Clostridia bacterium]|nr:aminoacyl-tRNA hydrolase [Clostridia bacterium]
MANIFDLFKQISASNETGKLPVKYIVAGLGNPGKEYENTRHNAGFLTIDYIAEKKGVKIDRAKFKALTATVDIGGVGVLLMKPQTFMNNSGEAVGEAARFYKLAPENIIVISDDVNLDVGRLRVRKSGSAGGQKGLNDIIEVMGTESIPRIRVGVGKKPHPDYDIKDWVLSSFTKEEKEALSAIYTKALSGVEKIVSEDINGAMQICNGK